MITSSDPRLPGGDGPPTKSSGVVPSLIGADHVFFPDFEVGAPVIQPKFPGLAAGDFLAFGTGLPAVG